MNFWTGLILGIIIGWLVEWIIDWLFWRRDAEEARETELQMEERLDATADLEARLSDAELEYQTRLRAVEEEWQSRLNLNEQQWQSQFSALEEDNDDLRARLSDMMAAATLGAAGAAMSQDTVEVEAIIDAPEEDVYADEIIFTEPDVSAAEFDLPEVTGDLPQVDEMNSDIMERLHLAGIDSVEELAMADPAGLSVALGLPIDDTEEWIARAGMTLSKDVEVAGDVDITVSDAEWDVEAPDIEMPSVEMPDIDMPDIDAPSIEVPDVAALGVDMPDIEMPDIEALGIDMPEIEIPDVAALAVEMPDIEMRSVEAPHVEIHHDDLTRVKGIGPKFAATLNAAGITSFDQLAAATPEQLRDVINPSPMQRLDFGGWSAQAVALGATRSVVMDDDLTELEGIGPVYAARLRENGISSFAELAAADEETLDGIIDAPAWRRINYGDWIAQARLAATGDKIALLELQDRLFRRDGDKLTLIHGLGGRSATALQAAGIDSFAALAEATPQQLEIALRDAGIRGGFDYESWISEAELRAAGKRVPAATRTRTTVQVVSCPQDLSAVDGIGTVFEDRLYGAGIGSYWSLAELPTDELMIILDAQTGVDAEAIKASAMQLAVKTDSLGRTWNGTPPDDFNALAGIGEVYERRLYEAGICTYETLAATSAERLAEICMAPAMQPPDYEGWIATAADLSANRSA